MMVMMVMIVMEVELCKCLRRSRCTCFLSPWAVCMEGTVTSSLNMGQLPECWEIPPPPPHIHLSHLPLYSSTSHRLSLRGGTSLSPAAPSQTPAATCCTQAAQGEREEAGSRRERSPRPPPRNEHMKKLLQYVESSRAGAHVSHTQSADLHPRQHCTIVERLPGDSLRAFMFAHWYLTICLHNAAYVTAKLQIKFELADCTDWTCDSFASEMLWA